MTSSGVISRVPSSPIDLCTATAEGHLGYNLPHCAAICTMPTLPGTPTIVSAHTTQQRTCGQPESWCTLPTICQEVVDAARLPKPAQPVCQQVPRLALRAGDQHNAPFIRLPAEHFHAARGALVAGKDGHLVFDIRPPAEAVKPVSAMSVVHLMAAVPTAEATRHPFPYARDQLVALILHVTLLLAERQAA